MSSNFDTFLTTRIGGLGKWHFIFILTLLPATTVPLEFFSQFAFLIPMHYCRQPFLNKSWSHSDVINLTIPFKADPQDPPMVGQPFEPCKEYNLDLMWNYLESNATFLEALTLREELYQNLSIRSCQHGVTFDMKEGHSKIFGVEFDLTCERRHFIPLSNAAYFIGMFVGSLIAGPICDHIGRRLVCIVFPIICAVSGIGTVFVYNIWVFIVLRFVTASLLTTGSLGYLVIASEWFNAEHRNIMAFVRTVWSGLIIRGTPVLFFYIMPSWRYAYACYFLLTLPVICGIFTWFESPRWSLSKGRVDEAEASILSVMRINGIKLTTTEKRKMREELEHLGIMLQSPSGAYQSVPQPEDGKEKGDNSGRDSAINSFRLLIGSSKFRLRIILWMAVWISITFLFIGIQYNAVHLGNIPYVVAFFTSIMSIPGSIIQYVSYRVFDRKRPITVLLGACAVLLTTAFLLTWFRFEGLPVVIVCTSCMMFVDALYTMLFIRTPETFPTNLRSITQGLCSGCSRFGMVLASYVEGLNKVVWGPLPLLIFSVSAAIAMLVSTLLPPGRGVMEEWCADSAVLQEDSEKEEEL